MIKTQEKFYRPGRFYFPKGFPRHKENSIARDFILAVGAAYVPTQTLVNTILSEKPYPIKAGFFSVTNPICTYPDAVKTYEAMMKLNFSVVAEISIPLRQPSPIWCFRRRSPGSMRRLPTGRPGPDMSNAIPNSSIPQGEAWSDMKMFNELAKRLGLGEYFFEDVDEKMLDFWLEPGGLTFEEFKKKRILYPESMLSERQ